MLVYRIRILLACQKGADLQGYAADQMASQQWRSQDIADARAQHGIIDNDGMGTVTTFARNSAPSAEA